MIRINKFIVGIRPSQKLFRLLSLYGSVIDSVLSARGTKPIDDKYYTEVSRLVEQGTGILRNEEQGNELRLSQENIVFVKDCYTTEKQFDAENILSEFRTIWKYLNEILHVHDIRRIGIVAEHQISVSKHSASAKLSETLTSISYSGQAAKFFLRTEDRRFATQSGVPDFEKDDFINIIRDYYDSALDTEHPNEQHFNANLDVQRYYSPLFNGNVFDEVAIHYRLFLKEKQKFEEDLKNRGLV